MVVRGEIIDNFDPVVGFLYVEIYQHLVYVYVFLDDRQWMLIETTLEPTQTASSEWVVEEVVEIDFSYGVLLVELVSRIE